MGVEANEHVVVVLMKGDEADATLDVVRADSPEVVITDQGTYWHLSAQDEIVIDMNRVGEELGEPIALSEWLVIMSTFVGRVITEPTFFRVTSDVTGIDTEVA